jgi:hypothetical protein
MDDNRKNVKENEYKIDYTDDFKKCMDLLIYHPIFNLKELDPMYEAIFYRFDYAIKKLISRFGLTKEFIEELDIKSIETFLNSCVSEVCNKIKIDTFFLNCNNEFNDQENKNSSVEILYDFSKLEPAKTKLLICHPIISTYIDEKSSRFSSLYSYNFAIYFFLFLVPLMYEYFTTGSKILIVASIYLLVRELLQFYMIYLDEKSIRRALNLHFSTPTNWIEISLVISSSTVVVISCFFEDEEWFVYEIAFIMMALLATLETTVLLTEYFQKQSKYIVILRTLFRTFLSAVFIVVIFNVDICILLSFTDANKVK